VILCILIPCICLSACTKAENAKINNNNTNKKRIKKDKEKKIAVNWDIRSVIWK